MVKVLALNANSRDVRHPFTSSRYIYSFLSFAGSDAHTPFVVVRFRLEKERAPWPAGEAAAAARETLWHVSAKEGGREGETESRRACILFLCNKKKSFSKLET